LNADSNQSRETLSREKILNSLQIFSDEPSANSLDFNFGKYAKQLFGLILSLVTDDKIFRHGEGSFAICLNGEWGSGKTSLLMQVSNMLEKEGKNKFQILWFDSWQYERLDPVLSLLQRIEIEYGRNASKLKGIIKALGLVSIDVVSRRYLGLPFQGITKYFRLSVNEIKDLPSTLDEIIVKHKNGKLIIIIDNLDRCSVDNALRILESIKAIFNAKNAIFVVSADLIKLQRAWTLKHDGSFNSLDDGRDHMEKIFQLILSLPPKAFFPEYQNKEYANQLIKDYLRNLTNELDNYPCLQELVASIIPPNPRKIKRVLSLVYFIGKNMQITNDPEFTDIFPLILIWSVATSYFSNLARILKEIPYVLPKMCLVIANTKDIGDLNTKIENMPISENYGDPNCMFAPYIKEKVSSSELEYVNKYVKDDPLLYRFLRAVALFYQIEGDYGDGPGRTSIDTSRYLNTHYHIESGLKKVIDEAGLISS